MYIIGIIISFVFQRVDVFLVVVLVHVKKVKLHIRSTEDYVELNAPSAIKLAENKFNFRVRNCVVISNKEISILVLICLANTWRNPDTVTKSDECDSE